MKKIFPRIVASGFSALVWLAVAACAPSVNTIENANAGANKTTIADKRIITDWGTEDFASIIEIRTGTTAGGILRVQLEIENDDANDYGRLAYCVEWFDAQGMKIAVPATWIPLSIPPEKRETISLVAPNADAVDFRISMMRSE